MTTAELRTRIDLVIPDGTVHVTRKTLNDILFLFCDVMEGYEGEGGDAPYLVYSALLTQSGTDDPTAAVLQNTIGEVPVLSFADNGKFNLTTIAALFQPGKTFIIPGIIGIDDPGDPVSFLFIKRIDDQTVRIITRQLDVDGGTFESVNGVLQGTAIEIRIYP